MFVKLFTSIYQGTLRGNAHGLLVFTNLLAHADRRGFVDIHPRAIADEVGLSVDEVRAALFELESPDEESRSAEHEGRRILRTDEHRAWGWWIVNYVKYRETRDETERREQNRLAQQRRRASLRHADSDDNADSQQSQPKSAHAEADAEAYAELIPVTLRVTTDRPVAESAESESKALPECPHAEVLKLWATLMPELQQPVKWTPARASQLRARWREEAREHGWKTEEDGLKFMARLFRWCRQSKFLMGKASARTPGGAPFVLTLPWLTKAENWAKVQEGNYHSEE